MKDIKETFAEKLHECNQHKKRVLEAKSRLKVFIPLTVKKYDELDSLVEIETL